MADDDFPSNLSVRELVELMKFNNLHLSSEKIDILSAEISSLESQGVIKKQMSDYSENPIDLNPDPNDPYKLVVDFSNFNKWIVRQEDCLPKPKSLWPSFRNKKYITTLKLNRGFYQIPLAEESKPYTGFIFKGEDYVFNRLAPGIRGCESTLHKLLTNVLGDILYDKVVVYVDTIYVLGENFEDQTNNLEESMKRLRDSGLKLSLPDCSFSMESAKLLGYSISNNKLEMLDKMLEPIRNSSCPNTLIELFDFMVAARFYQEMIKGFARLAAPLTDLFEESQPLTQDLQVKIKHEMCFDMLKQKLLAKPVLAIFDQNAETMLRVTASRIAIEGDLYQIDSKTKVKHAVGFYSEKVGADKKNWDLFDLEMLAILKSCRYFEVYLKKCEFTVHSANPPEMFEDHFKAPSARLKSLKLKIDNLSFKICLVSQGIEIMF